MALFRNRNKEINGLLIGSFNPPTKEHIALIKTASLDCDNLFVLIYETTSRSQFTVNNQERSQLLNDLLNNTKINCIPIPYPPVQPYNRASSSIFKGDLEPYLLGRRIHKYFSCYPDANIAAKTLRAELITYDSVNTKFPVSSQTILEEFNKYSHLLPKAVKEIYSRNYPHPSPEAGASELGKH